MQLSVFDRILDILCTVFEAYSAVLFMPESTSSAGEYRIVSSFSLGDSVDREAAVVEGQGLVGWILRHHEPLLVANVDQRHNHLGYYHGGEEQNIKAFMGCVLKDGRGVLCVDSKRQYSFAEKDLKFLQLFAELIVALEEAMQANDQQALIGKYFIALRTVYALRRQHSRWAEFLQHILGLIAGVTGYAYCAFCTRDSFGENYVVEEESVPLLRKGRDTDPIYPMNNGIVGWVFRNGQPVISDAKEGMPDTPLMGRSGNMPQFQTVMAFPLIIQGKTRGVLCLGDNVPQVIEEATKDFIRMTAEHLALFLENLYVKCKLRDFHRASQLQ